MRRFWMALLISVLLVSCGVKEIIEDDPSEEEIPQEEEEIIEEVEDDFLRFFLNGAKTEDQKAVGVMAIIENTSSARPQSGLSVADVVYEVAMEKYSTTRFLAVFSSELPNKVGPMRSARIPFVILAKQWMLPLAHYGAAESGEGDAYSLLRNIRWPIRFDGVSGLNSAWFFRDSVRKSPHNAYFDAQGAFDKIPQVTLTRGFAFSDEMHEGIKVTELELSIVNSIKVSYQYDEGLMKYRRWINGEPMLDAYNDSQVAVSNIIVLSAPHSTVTSTQYVMVDFSKGGALKVFSGGVMRSGNWKMENDMLVYLDDKGEPMVLLPGNSWVQIVSAQMKVTYE